MGTSTLQILVMGEDRASGVLRGVSSSLTRFGQSATGLGTSLLPMSAAAGAVGVSALKMAADYETAMNLLEASTGASALEMQQLGDMAVALGADITLPGTSAKDAADAMLELSKAGLSVNDTMAAAKGVLQMSAAAQIGNAQAAEITANALNMFGMAGDQATAVADLLAAGANKSSADITDMADALKMSGSVAAMAGVGLQDVTTAIALMANQGIKGSDAGTSLKTMLLSLQSPTTKAKDLIAGLGISIFDANGAMLPMPALIDQFGGALNGMTQEQRSAALATIFGTDAVRAANVLLLGGQDAWNDMSAAVGAGGEAAKMAAAQNKGLAGALDGLKSTLETVLLTGAKPFLETLSNMVTRVSETVGAFAQAHPEIVSAGLAFAGVLAAAAPLALGIGAISGALGALLSPIGLAVLAVAGLAAAFATNFAGINDIASGFLGMFTTDMFAAGDASLKLTEGLYTLGTTLGMTEIQAEMFSQTVGDMVSSIVAWMQEAWPQILATVSSVMTSVRQVVTDVLSFVVSFVTDAVTNTQAIWASTWNTIMATLSSVLASIQSIVNSVFSAVAAFLAAHGDEIRAVLQTAWQTISEIVNTVAQIVQTLVTRVFGAIATFLAQHKAEIVAVLEAAWNLIRSIIETVLGTIKGIVNAVLKAIQGDWKGAWEDIKKVADTLWNGIRSIIENALDLILKVVGTSLQEVKDWFVNKFNEILSFLRGINLSEIGRNMIEGLIGGIRSMAGSLVEAAKGVVSSAIDAAKRLLGIGSPSRVFMELGQQTMAGMAIGLNSQAPIDAMRAQVRALLAAVDPLTQGFEAGGFRLNGTAGGQAQTARVGAFETGRQGAAETGATYNITVNTAATSGTYLADIMMARALVGA